MWKIPLFEGRYDNHNVKNSKEEFNYYFSFETQAEQKFMEEKLMVFLSERTTLKISFIRYLFICNTVIFRTVTFLKIRHEDELIYISCYFKKVETPMGVLP